MLKSNVSILISWFTSLTGWFTFATTADIIAITGGIIGIIAGFAGLILTIIKIITWREKHILEIELLKLKKSKLMNKN